jgi:hypothetical protein
MTTTDTLAEQPPTSATWQLAIRVNGANQVPVDAAFAEAVVDVGDGDLPVGAADLRARAAVVVPDLSAASMVAWATLCGVAGRILDVYVAGTENRLACAAAATRGRKEQLPQPERHVEQLDVAVSDIASFDEAQRAQLRWARRVTVSSAGHADDYLSVAYAAGLRDRRGDGPRFPRWELDGTTVDLEGARAGGGGQRRASNAADSSVTVDTVGLSARQQRLNSAAAVPVEGVLAALGSGRDGDLWQCPRPARHTHGDATPSARTSGGSFRCFRCDPEWVDPLRLVMDCLSIGPDDAATALLAGPTAFDAYRDYCVETRERLAAV